MSAPRVLLVEDDPAVRRFFASGLTGVDCEVVELEDGAEAVAVLERDSQWALVFSDFDMGDVNGMHVLAAARKHAPLARRVLCTGNPTGDAAAACRSLGAWLIPKPVSAGVLRALGRSLDCR